ncbi:MAG: DUF1836 domain-containing protein [Oscillospiraceae bacterium]|nr:DUF1836 domain-containing protein [Oscillospiraceae bacterium]
MPGTKESAAQRLTEWLQGLEKFDLPDWDSLPQLELYMDQVILLLTRYLAPLERDGEERTVTASIINNYVRMKVMPPPVKKRYSRTHLAYLIMICTLKQSLSISCIQRLLPQDHSEEAARTLYTDFVRQYRASIRFLCSLPLSRGELTVEGGARLPLEGENGLAATSAILATLSKMLTEFLLAEKDGKEDPIEDEDE